MAGSKETIAIEERRTKAFDDLKHTCTRCGRFLDPEETEILKTDDPSIMLFAHRYPCTVQGW